MGYDHYCMSCGQKMNQDSLLFDMQYLLTADKAKKLQILKFRITDKKFSELIKNGQREDGGYYRVTIPFSKAIEIIADENNLNNPKLLEMKPADVDAYIKQFGPRLTSTTPSGSVISVKKKVGFDSFSDDFDEEDESNQQDDTQQGQNAEQTVEEYKTPEAIELIEKLDISNTDKVETRSFVCNDFKYLLSAFGIDGANDAQNVECSFSFSIQAQTEKDNDGNTLNVGYDFKLAGTNFISVSEARICPKCGAPVFEHAGTAKHQAIAYIGDQSSGKTSLILSLASYAVNHMYQDIGGLDDDISAVWRNNTVIPTVSEVTIVSLTDRVKNDMAGYLQGYAPAKTEALHREDAYSVTFRIQNTVEKGKYYLLSLVDLPGELCVKNNHLDREKIQTLFPVALCCDAVIACFDTSRIDPNHVGTSPWIHSICDWVEEFQKMRSSKDSSGDRNDYIPMILVLTKCKELEEGEQIAVPAARINPIEQVYFLNEERRKILSVKGLYRTVYNNFRDTGGLSSGYHAMLRCSPYGYPAPTRDDEKKLNHVPVSLPKPKNVDSLMRWLLSVSGCIPTEGEYRGAPDSAPVILNDFCISRLQIRNEAPASAQRLEEALARCALFANPGKYDEEIVGNSYSRSAMIMTNWKIMLKPNGNAN